MFSSIVSKGVQYLVPANKNYHVTRITDAIMELKDTPETKGNLLSSFFSMTSFPPPPTPDTLRTSLLTLIDYLYLDPKFPLNATPRKNTPFKEAIVFMTGGGNYLEYQNLRDFVQKQVCSLLLIRSLTFQAQPEHSFGGTEKQIVYGSSELCTASEFLRQLGVLGSSVID
jgi:hypothetical protein